MSEPLVSISMITYNQRAYIVEAMECALQQETEYPFELVIGDDCSADGTDEMVEDYQKRHPNIIRVIRSERNVGVTANEARNLAACRGKYVAFCDGDDFWHRRDKLQLQVAYLEAHPDCGLVCSDRNVHYVASGKTIRDFNVYRKRRPPENPTVADFARGVAGLDSGAIPACTVVLRKDLLDRIIAADPYLHGGRAFMMNDTQRWAEIAHLAKMHYFEESLATQNAPPQSVSRPPDWRRSVRFLISVAEMFLYLCEKYALPPEIRARHERNWCRYSFELAFLERDFALAGRVLGRGYQFSPKEWVKYCSMRNALTHGSLRRVLWFRQRLVSRLAPPNV